MLESLRLKDFRGFTELDLTFEPDLTVLVGVNGAGKSSILRALVLLEQDDPEGAIFDSMAAN